MTTAVRRRRGTTAQHATFTGLEGEISIDTTKDTVVVHDGTTAGGHPLAKENNTALTGNVTVTTNSSSTALTITQDGTGNALEVRDVTGDSTPFVVDASGNVGIGGTASTKLDVTGNIRATGYFIADNTKGMYFGLGDGSTAILGDSSTDYIALQTASAERLRIDSSGNVGVGVAPSYKFEVKTGNDCLLRFVDLGATQLSQIQSTNLARSAYAPLAIGGSYTILETGGNERLRVDSSGNVGIGGAAPAGVKLQVSDSASNASQFRVLETGSSVDTRMVSMGTGGLAGVIGTYSNHPLVLYTNGGEKLRATSAGLVTANNSVGLGYGTGSGGTVTQATSKSTSVTLNKPSGAITMHNAALAAGATVAFTVNNSTVSTSDIVAAQALWGAVGGGSYRVETVQVGVGAFDIRVTNISAGSLSEALVINFAVIKGSTT